MRVFISWSGEPSKSIAEALGKWLPRVHQKLDPFVSSQDIKMGKPWREELASELATTSCGILCLTPANVDSRWVLYEAGALSKDPKVSTVCPILFAGLTKANVERPLADLQLAEFNQTDIMKVLKSLNAALKSDALKDDILSDSYVRWWSDLVSTVREAENAHASAQELTPRDEREILEEILELCRQALRLQVERPVHGALLRAWRDAKLRAQEPQPVSAAQKERAMWDGMLAEALDGLFEAATAMTTPEPPAEAPESEPKEKGEDTQ